MESHSWDEGIVTEEPTEDTEGIMTYQCTRCGQTMTSTIPALPHNHRYEKKVVKPTCETDGYDQYVCPCGHSYTDNEVKAAGHQWNDATCEVPKTCAVCGTVTGPLADHIFERGQCKICGAADTAFKLGDVNGDGTLSYKDALKVLRASIKLDTLTAEQEVLADFDGNGTINYEDALKILRTSIGLE